MADTTRAPRTRKKAEPAAPQPADDVVDPEAVQAGPPVGAGSAVGDLDPLLLTPPKLRPAEYVGKDDEVVVPSPIPGMVRVFGAAEYAARLAHLSAPFPRDWIEHLPKQVRRDDQDRGKCTGDRRYSADGIACGGYHALSVHLDYVGHAGITQRLMEVDPLSTWEAIHTDPAGAPILNSDGAWIRLTVLGVTTLGFGDAAGKRGPNAVKEVIGDALRNAAMRRGVATYLWSKSDHAAALVQGPADDGPQVERSRGERRGEDRAARRQQSRPAAATPEPPAEVAPPVAPGPPVPPATLMALRQQVLDAADAHPAPGRERDGELKVIYDRIVVDTPGALAQLVPIPDPWQTPGGASEATLENLIRGARSVRMPSRTANMDDDPWANDPDAQGPADPQEEQA